MKINKIGHCCLLIEEGDVRLLTDPGNWSTGQNEVKDIDAVLITHEHPDHLHMDSLKIVLQNNPQAKVIANTAVAAILDKEGIAYELIEDGQAISVKGVVIEGFNAEHAEIYREIPRILNTGLFIADHLFYPGDAFINPKRPIPVLALPTAGPWMKSSEAIDYALELKPGLCFPVHDAVVAAGSPYNFLVQTVLEKHGLKFHPLGAGESLDA